MDIVGGAGISKGPANFMSTAYLGIPIAITVEGANALTRSLISFGQVSARLAELRSAARALLCSCLGGSRCRWLDGRLCGGQGLNRSHPHLLNLIETIRAGDDLPGFNRRASLPPPPLPFSFSFFVPSHSFSSALMPRPVADGGGAGCRELKNLLGHAFENLGRSLTRFASVQVLSLPPNTQRGSKPPPLCALLPPFAGDR